MDSLEAIRQTFFEECAEQLAELEAGLLAMSDGTGDDETVNAVFRAVHSVKGGAAAFELTALVRFAHLFETVLDRIRAGELAAPPDVIGVLLRAADVLADLVAAAKSGDETRQGASSAVAGELDALTHGVATPTATAPTTETPENQDGPDLLPLSTPATDDNGESSGFHPIAIDFSAFADTPEPAPAPRRSLSIHFTPHPDLYTRGNEATLLMRELERIGDTVVSCVRDDLPLLDALDPNGACLSWQIELNTDADEAAIRAVFEFVEQDCDLDIRETRADAATLPADPAADPPAVVAPAPDPGPAEAGRRAPPHTEGSTPAATIRVDLDKVDRLINLVGELVINRAMLSQRIGEAGAGALPEVAVALDELEHLTREIQESIMAIRAQPVRSLFQRMSRIVREAAAATGKSVRLRIDGEATEVDKTVIERLTDPLTHMIRNAVDHGLETPQARRAAGKSEEGVVHLAASHRSGRVVIEIADDGAGIDRPKVREAAVRKGLIAADAQLGDADIDGLLFLPGFSTASRISDLSGRGVGMDVVKRSIQALGGRITTSSNPGRGTTFTMSLPLTLAILDGMVVRLAGRTVIIPLTTIVETLKPQQRAIHALGSGARVIAIRESFIPLVDVAAELGFHPGRADLDDSVVILVEVEGGARRALLADCIEDQRQVVIKSLETNYGLVEGIAAATILGDGRVALILDVDAIVQRAGSGTTLPAFEFSDTF